jgi:hypothetical protein
MTRSHQVDFKTVKGDDLWLIKGHLWNGIKLFIVSDTSSIGLYTYFNLKQSGTLELGLEDNLMTQEL